MSHRINGGITALLIIVAAVAGGLVGYFIPRGGYDMSAEGRIDYGCEMAGKLEDVQFSIDDLGNLTRGSVFEDITIISVMFGGFGLPPSDNPTFEERLGTDLYMSLVRLDEDLMTDTFADVVDYCEAR